MPFHSSIVTIATIAFGCTALATKSEGSGLSHWEEPVPIYKKSSYCIDARVDDLLSRMTIQEKAGQLFQARINQEPLDGPEGASANALEGNTTNHMLDKHMSHFNLATGITNATETAEFMNLIKERALDSRLGIPVTISTDPRHSFTENVVRKFAEVTKEEYMAVGIRASLHPQVNLTTEPRWARIGNTWGENSTLTSQMVVEYIKGFQGDKSGTKSVKTVTKHFPDSGPMKNRENSHFVYSKNQIYPGNNFEEHLKPFKAAIAAGATEMMLYYSRSIEFSAEYFKARNYTVVRIPEEADYTLLRYNAPYEPRSDIKLDRPAVIPEVIERAAAVLGSYGSDNEAFLDVVFGITAPKGKLPFDLPRSMEAVQAQMEDVPFDTRNSVFRYGHGLSYAIPCDVKQT
ncbi:hypothetical protein PENSTE_c016G04500 [Penicillium steckii]|uniref:beta-glucosidase n=1 Tax=Penicillium steckii TaxID=303698 RepID=A0A1V6SY99_9EURO|nr:hypothetical protein PENSTE_c016G04500 [Penicillium steckii]